jgi:restriction system protein
MKSELINITYREEYTRSYDKRYIAEITHTGLKEFKLFSANEKYILDNKIDAHIAKLEEKWDKLIQKQNQEASQKEAENRTQTAIKALYEVDDILIQRFSIKDKLEWESLKNEIRFKTFNPKSELSKRLNSINLARKEAFIDVPNKPMYPNKPEFRHYQPKLSLFDILKLSFFDIFTSQRDRIKDTYEQFQNTLKDWEKQCQEIDTNYTRKQQEIEIINLGNKEKTKKMLALFEEKKKIVQLEVAKEARAWLVTKAAYLNQNSNGVLEYCALVLNDSQYPDNFPTNFELDYNSVNKILVIDYSLPTVEDLPTLNEVKFIKNELKEYHISDVQVQKLYDTIIYKITLRTLHEIFEADEEANSIDAISFNGWVNAINKATGKRENNCIVSIQVRKTEFMEVDLEHVDPKTCFKNFKGVGSSKLSGLTAIQPILRINRTDKRFTNHYEVASGIDSSTNLASMDWEDFEHLIREVFAREFSSNGGEVNVTQASRDGGVDAIAFDPDPIRGGKIVIQAKRYTNTVGVAAVRDLYGTVMNEGATKGILVTTADYGSDSYEFAKGKPLTLMNGANLLYLLEKHGYKAKIDIKEARKEMKK